MNKKILYLLFLGLILIPIASIDAVITATNVNSSDCFSDPRCLGSFPRVLLNLINYLITGLGIIFLIWGFIKYLTAKDSKEVKEKAKTIVIIAVICLLIAAICFVVIDFYFF